MPERMIELYESAKDSTKITPDMLPLITLTQADIDAIVTQVPGGVSNIQDIYGMTPLQSGMLYHYLMTKEGDPYVFVSRMRFIDRTSLDRYSDAVQQLIVRYDILRTAIFWDGLSESAQVVLRHVASLLSKFSPSECESDKSVLEQMSQKFHPCRYRLDLTQAPLFRLLAARESEGNWVAVQLMHHSIADHSTLERLQAEIQAIMNGKPKVLTTPKPFRNFVAQTRLGISSDEHTRFFSDMLGDIDEPSLPFGLGNIDIDGCEINKAHLKLPQTLNDQLRKHARHLQVSLASICHLAWAQLISKATGRQTVVFGTVLHGQGNDIVMGPTINTLPIRLNMDERSVETAVCDTHVKLSALLANEHASLVLAQHCSDVPAGLPLFSALLSYRHIRKTEVANRLLSGVSVIDKEKTTSYPLTLSMKDSGSSLNQTVQVVSARSATQICAYMQQSLHSLVEALSLAPEKPVHRLRVMPPGERNLLLHGGNQTCIPHLSVECLHQLFEAQVMHDGRTVALECEGKTLSYSELNMRANQLAHYIIARGVKPDDRIAICVERSIAMVVAILGILKAGCAYVPLDPAYPSKRLTIVLLEAEPIFLLADSIGCNALGDHEVPVIELEEVLLSDLPINNPDIAELGLTPAHLAYVIYTSGSTGIPKGVMFEHQQIIQLFPATKERLNFNKHDNWCLFNSISFGVSVWEMWNSIYYGSQLTIAPQNITRSANELYDWICMKGITVLNLTPSVFKMLMQVKNSSTKCDQLRYLIFVGEALDPTSTMEWYAKYGESGTIVTNAYGISETSLISEVSYGKTAHHLENSKNINSIGRPLPDLRVYLLDFRGDPALLCAEGELYVSGARVARGYLNRSELTAERFLPDPFHIDVKARMYRTGDLARFLLDGNLVYLGRSDQLVKIRGFRIEVGEIEARLVEHSLVREAAVQTYVTGSDTYLVAYVVVANSDESLAQNLRKYLLQLLPDYMVPMAYVCLPSLPLTPNGKLNRRALPPPNDASFARQQYEAPQGAMEEKLAQIWREILKVDRISRHDNFFALGGHSLLVGKLLAHLRHIGLDTTIKAAFDAPNLANLASTLTRHKAITIPPNLIKVDSTKITPDMLPLITLTQADIDAIVTQVPGGVSNIQDIYGLTPLQSGMLYHYLMTKEGDPYVFVSRMRFIDRTSLERYSEAVQQLIVRYDILRTAIFWDGLSESTQVVLRHVASLLSEFTPSECESDKSVLEQMSQKFHPCRYRLDLTQAPLFRLLAARESEGNWVAVQLMHHSIIEHSTLRRLQAEVHAIINGKTEVSTASIPFRNFVAQTQLGISSDEHTRFFSDMLGDIDEPTLPFLLSDIDIDGFEINEVRLKLPQALNDQLRTHARQLQVSLASMCHLAWAKVLATAIGREAVVFGTIIFGGLQTGDGNDYVMGPMINTLPIRVDINERNIEVAIQGTHARLSALLTHEHAPLVLAQRCSSVPSGSSLFSALLNYRHNPKTNEIISSLPGVSFLDNVEQTNYPLVLSVDDDNSSLYLSVQVASSMSSTQICAYMKQSLESLVDALNHTTEKSIQGLRVMPSAERTLLLHSWNQIAVNDSPICCAHQLFEAQVTRNGHATALECKGQTLSYTELNTRANRLAHYLIAQGVKPDDRITLCVERSLELIIGILGILKASCAYVPLDAAYPSQRLTNILLDAGPIFLLADSIGRSVLGDHQIPTIDLENPMSINLPIENPDTNQLGLIPSNLAYVIYTSGSTGTPKGVMVEHQQVTRLFGPTHDRIGFNANDKWCLFHSFSFDVSIWEILSALYDGSQLWIASHDTIRNMDEFYDWIRCSGITVLNQTPSAFKMLMRVINTSSRLNRLRFIVFVGEAFDPLIAKEWHENCGKNGAILVNIYGPTETTVYSTLRRIQTSKDALSIGRPLPDLCVYLLDPRGEPVLLGAEGEIYIAGAGVARGYLNRPERTAECFLPDPFNISSGRMYRTGDLARYLSDGNLVFLGRVDQQLKIRGFRIELGEIEARLVEHPDVQEAVVQPYGNGLDARLVAYVVADAYLAQDLRDYLLAVLPDYMVPAAYVRLTLLPLTPNGKLDRRALPTPDEDAFVHQQYEAPQGEMEEKLAKIWSDLLNIDRISRHDNFFALGGHSLLAVKLLAQLIQIGLNTNVRKVFDSPNLAILAATLTHYYKAVTIPPNMIMEDSAEITPDMLPLITLSQADINAIIQQIPGGVANIQDIYGLTPLQNGMLYHHLMANEGDSYLIVDRFHFNNLASLERYANAMQRVIQRHDILRTAIFWDGLSEPAQVVLRQVPSLLTNVTVDQSNKEIEEQMCNQFNPHRYRMDLTQPPLLRLMAAQAPDGSWFASQIMHHSIVDHSTLEKLYRETYAIMEGKTESLKMSAPFRHFVAQAQLETIAAEHMRFFTEMLGGIDEPTLPFGLSDVNQDGCEINEAHLKLSPVLNDQLRAQAQNSQVSLASMCHLAYAQILSKACGCEAAVFGTVLRGRLEAEEGNSIVMGPTINTLPICLHMNERSIEITVRDTHVRLSALLAHEHASLVLAQRCSNVPVGSPLFSALLNYRHNQKNQEVNTELPGVRFLAHIGQTNYPLILSVDDNETSLRLSIQVMSSMSAERICAYMRQSLESLATALAQAPQSTVGDLAVIPSEERTLLLHSWNQTAVTDSSVCCLHQLFEAQVASDEHTIAVECEGHTLSYSELNTRANCLARHLIARGVKPDDRIALCVVRNSELIVAILGILKAGAAYIPLDLSYASQRLTKVLTDAQPVFLVADEAGRNVLGDYQVPVIALKKTLDSEYSIDNPDTTELGLTSNHLAYIIYTSGSTGTPKGVMVEHYQVVRLIQSAHEQFEFNKHDKWCLFHSISFDVSVWEIWSSLLRASQLSIMSHNIARSADKFYDWICNRGITVLNQTPSAFKILVRMVDTRSRCDKLRYIIFAGEELDPSIAKGWNDKNETALVDMYGPTETLHATLYQLDTSKSVHSIGRPLRDLCAYLLDQHGVPVLLGVEGEIYIGGAGVARGYLNRPELNAERFLPDPFNISSGRMYRTGDLARYLPNGNLVFLGRVDQQVKIRGFRIELGEIEARLVEHPDVQEAVVQPYGNGLDTRLVAYVVAEADTFIVQNLRSYLLTLLPDYMVPAAYVCLSSLPLTPNGKLNRRALPTPDDDAFAREQYEAPHGEMEQKLADIWHELLHIDRISRHDNFFALGGHSLLIVRLLAQLRQIGLDTTVREVFDSPTLAALASMLTRYTKVTIPPNMITDDTAKITPDMLPLITLSQADIDAIIKQIPNGVANIQDIYGLTHLQNGMLYHHLMANEGDPYLLVSRINFTERTLLERYANAVQKVIERHDILRTAIFWDGFSEPAQVVLRRAPFSLTEIKLNKSNKAVFEQLSQEYHPRHYRLDLTHAPLVRLIATSDSEGNWAALQIIHHLIIDNSTLERLQAEIHRIMHGKIEKSTELTPFRNFVAQARQELSSAKHTQFFTEMLVDIDEPTLPFGLSDVDQNGCEINQAHLKLSPALNDQLRSQARNLQVNLASVCHLAWALVLAKASARESIVFGTVLLGRLQAGEGNSIVMGPTINTLPIRLDVDERSVEIAVHDTHVRLSALLVHEHASLVLAQRCSNVPAGLPLFSALLNYRHNRKTKEADTSLPGVCFVGSDGQITYPLSLSIDDDDSSLCLSVEVIASISAQRICAYVQQSVASLVDALTHKPHHPIRKLRVMPSDEQIELLHSWNQTEHTDSPVCCLHQLFEMQVACDEQAIAVEYEERTLSYSKLNIQSNRLAHYLIAQGVKPDDRIALCVERSLVSIVVILGVLKAGCAYLPLDPSYPSQRLLNILRDADPVFLMADEAGRSVLGYHQVPVINVEKTLPSNLPAINPDIIQLGLTPSHLAYIIYTSGSTGTPKGVMIEHQQVAQHFQSIHKQFDFKNHDKWCLFHSISFDVSVWEIWGAMLYGSQLSIVSHDTMHLPDEFYNWICSKGITVLNQIPSLFKMLLRAKGISSQLDQLRYIILGGEVLEPLILQEWYEKYDKTRTILVNIYGPTEAIINSTRWICDVTAPKHFTVPIGRPMCNKRIYLLNSYGEPVLLGAEGEIYIGGTELARGYLNRPELSAKRFLPDPFNNEIDSTRMYRTGDLARYLPNGNLVFLGRVDQQVKIRGFRIELGEIEARLVEYPDVQEAVVQPYGNALDTRLVAYVVAEADTFIVQNLRSYLLTLLPDYMVPAAYVCLSSLPLTPNGKLNRRALPTPDDESFAREQYEAPRGEMEEKLANIWRELLHIDRISRHDNFFELGGHSLLVINFINKAKSHNLHIDARGVFSFPILKSLAEQISKQSERLYSHGAIPVRQYGNETPLFLLPDGWGDISYGFELSHSIDKSIPVYMFPWPSPEDEQPSSIQQKAEAMIAHIKAICTNGPCAIAGYSSGGILAFEIAKQLLNSGYPVSFLGLIDTPAPPLAAISQTETFLSLLYRKFSVFQAFSDSSWWTRVSKLTLSESIEEIHKTNINLGDVDIEWEALLSKQCFNYKNICTSFEFDLLQIPVHLFKAEVFNDRCDHNYGSGLGEQKKLFNYPKFGWEKYNLSNNFNVVPVDGDHFTMMTDPKNRHSLGKQLTKVLLSKSQ